MRRWWARLKRVFHLLEQLPEMYRALEALGAQAIALEDRLTTLEEGLRTDIVSAAKYNTDRVIADLTTTATRLLDRETQRAKEMSTQLADAEWSLTRAMSVATRLLSEGVTQAVQTLHESGAASQSSIEHEIEKSRESIEARVAERIRLVTRAAGASPTPLVKECDCGHVAPSWSTNLDTGLTECAECREGRMASRERR